MLICRASIMQVLITGKGSKVVHVQQLMNPSYSVLFICLVPVLNAGLDACKSRLRHEFLPSARGRGSKQHRHNSHVLLSPWNLCRDFISVYQPSLILTAGPDACGGRL